MKKFSLFFVALGLLLASCSQLSENEISDAADFATSETIIGDNDMIYKSVTITVSIVDGALVYSDGSGQQGRSIFTRAGYGAEIVWQADTKSGVKDITNVNLNGDLFLLAEKPQQVARGTWVAKVGYKGEGEISYSVEIPDTRELYENPDIKGIDTRDPPPPRLRIP